MQKLSREFPGKERKKISVNLPVSKFIVTAMVVAVTVLASPSLAQNKSLSAFERGKYIFQLSGCVGCHTNKKGGGQILAGGRAFKTDFGTFYSPNISQDKTTGIGTWTFKNFRTALRQGIAPNGTNYFPIFPYTSYTHMTDADLADLWVYIKAQPAIKNINKNHDLKPPYGWRWAVTFWKWLYLNQGPKTSWSRGQYVTEALAHCAECHTPRNFLGGYISEQAYAGTQKNPEGIMIPNITADQETGIGKWTTGDLDILFTLGMLPDTDFVSGVMAESISHSTSKMTDSDRTAMIRYLQTINPVINLIKSKKTINYNGEDW